MCVKRIKNVDLLVSVRKMYLTYKMFFVKFVAMKRNLSILFPAGYPTHTVSYSVHSVILVCSVALWSFMLCEVLVFGSLNSYLILS